VDDLGDDFAAHKARNFLLHPPPPFYGTAHVQGVEAMTVRFEQTQYKLVLAKGTGCSLVTLGKSPRPADQDFEPPTEMAASLPLSPVSSLPG